jgi:hypothetical protein
MGRYSTGINQRSIALVRVPGNGSIHKEGMPHIECGTYK